MHIHVGPHHTHHHFPSPQVALIVHLPDILSLPFLSHWRLLSPRAHHQRSKNQRLGDGSEVGNKRES